jgi:hypothetical protein
MRNVASRFNTMSESTAWSLVAASFLILGFFGYASFARSKILMILGALVSAFVLNVMASQIFTAVEIRTIKRLGTIQEDQMLPDMPNLMAGLILFGWVFFLGGFFVGRLGKRAQPKNKSEPQAVEHQSTTRPESKSE